MIELTDIEIPVEHREEAEREGARDMRWYRAIIDGTEYHVIISRNEYSHELGQPPRWHLSVSGADAVPPWEALVAVAHRVRPGVPFAVGIPPESWWVNYHGHTLHMVEVRDEGLVHQWRLERKGHTPT